MKKWLIRLNGWQRLGLVLSAVWLIAGFFYMRHIQIQRGEGYADRMFDICFRNDSITNCIQATNIYYLKAYVINWEELFLYIFMPVPLSWLSVYLLKKIILWVRDGFKNY